MPRRSLLTLALVVDSIMLVDPWFSRFLCCWSPVMMRNDAVVSAFSRGQRARAGALRTDGRSLWSYELKIAEKTLGGVVVADFTSGGGQFVSQTTSQARQSRQAGRRHRDAARTVREHLRQDALLMGDLVNLAEYRQRLRQEEQAKTQEELEHLKMLVEAWVAHIGEAEVKPYFLPLDDHLTEKP